MTKSADEKDLPKTKIAKSCFRSFLAETAGVGESFVKRETKTFIARKFFPKIKAMKCEDLQFNLSMYADEDLNESEKIRLESHLEKCPVCRAKQAEFVALGNDLRNFAPSPMPADLQFSVRNVVAAQLNSPRPAQTFFSGNTGEWLQFKVMPYVVGTFAAFALFSMFMISLLSAREATEQAAEIAEIKSKAVAITSAAETSDFSFDYPVIPSSEFAAMRRPVSQDSPSINTKSAFLEATKTLVSGKIKDDEVTFVADVFQDGMAQIAQVVEPPRSRKSLEKLEKALQNDPAYAPFVPAGLDNRSDVVRVVLKIQLVDVKDTSVPKKSSRKK